MNKYWRRKNFKQEYKKRQVQDWDNWDWDTRNTPLYPSPPPEDISEKELKKCAAVILSLLVCIIIYFLCIHFNLFGIKDWYRENPQSSSDTYAGQTYTDQVGQAEQAYKEHIVKPNETLWQIAEQYHPNEDTRKVVYEIREANADETGEKLDPKILPGQVVRVPIDLPSRQDNRQGKKQPVNEEWLTNEWLTMEATAYCACEK